MTNGDKASIVLVHRTWADDVAATHRAIDRMPGKALLVDHSWDGAVMQR